MIPFKRENNVLVESAKKLKVFDEVDVLVIGGGMAGIGATVTAARSGAKTLLIDKANALGGLFTLGLVPRPNGFVGGIGQELIDRLKTEGAYCQGNVDPEKTKLVLDQLVAGAGADILLGAYAVDTIVEENTVRGIVLESKGGRHVILAQRTIDASGDADIAYFAGVPCECGRKVDQINQAVSTNFRVGNVNWRKHKEWRDQDPKWSNALKKALRSEDLPYLPDNQLSWIARIPGRSEGNEEVCICLAHSRYAHTLDPRDLTRMLMEGRQQIRFLIKFLRKYIPGFKECYLIDTSVLLGIRESRRIRGEYVLTAEDLASGKRFDDAIAISNHGFDIHHPTIPGNVRWVKLSVKNEEKYVAFDKRAKDSTLMPPKGRKSISYDYNKLLSSQDGHKNFYTIPYRCLIPVKRENILVAGRCLSATFEAQSGARRIMVALDTGQAAGLASILSLNKQIPYRKVDIGLLQRKLCDQGVKLGGD